MQLLVDAANVVGSRPDGWWKDRAGAAARLVDQLAALPGTEVAGAVVDDVVVVLEGQARAGVPPTPDDEVGTTRLQVVHAAGSGDDTLAELCRPGVVLVTADRELADRARDAGAGVVSPRRLLDALERDRGH